MQKPDHDSKVFHVEGFGEVGFANLYAFVPFDGYKRAADLAVGEKSEGRFQNPTSDKKPVRIAHVR